MIWRVRCIIAADAEDATDWKSSGVAGECENKARHELHPCSWNDPVVANPFATVRSFTKVVGSKGR
jgi:hypothetical protein